MRKAAPDATSTVSGATPGAIRPGVSQPLAEHLARCLGRHALPIVEPRNAIGIELWHFPFHQRAPLDERLRIHEGQIRHAPTSSLSQAVQRYLADLVDASGLAIEYLNTTIMPGRASEPADGRSRESPDRKDPGSKGPGSRHPDSDPQDGDPRDSAGLGMSPAAAILVPRLAARLVNAIHADTELCALDREIEMRIGLPIDARLPRPKRSLLRRLNGPPLTWPALAGPAHELEDLFAAAAAGIARCLGDVKSLRLRMVLPGLSSGHERIAAAGALEPTLEKLRALVGTRRDWSEW